MQEIQNHLSEGAVKGGMIRQIGAAVLVVALFSSTLHSKSLLLVYFSNFPPIWGLVSSVMQIAQLGKGSANTCHYTVFDVLLSIPSGNLGMR